MSRRLIERIKRDLAIAKSILGIVIQKLVRGERIVWRTKWTVIKNRDPTGKIASLAKAGLPTKELIKTAYEVSVFHKNVALNEGLQYLIDAICGIEGSPTLWDNTNARVGVGSDTTAEDASQTGLIDATPTFASMDSGYPQRSGQIAKWRGTFGDGEAEEAWEEFTVDNGATSNKNLCRKVTSKGTKSSGESWTLEVQITFS